MLKIGGASNDKGNAHNTHLFAYMRVLPHCQPFGWLSVIILSDLECCFEFEN